ncbi:MAG: glycosyltransferase family 39 protein [Verrucomicrobia bacterium]|nr:glycosyltransferase family 39 protein [Verrucomicrobiota bacterium]
MTEHDTTSTQPQRPAWRVWLTRRHAFIVVLLLIVLFVQAAISAWQNSVTVDEFAHLPAGYMYWAKGSFDIYHRNPPLAKLWAALPLFRSSMDRAFMKQSFIWSVSFEFMYRNEAVYRTLFWRARIMIALLSVGLGYLVFRWSRELFGIAGGLLSLAVYALSPNVITHSSIVSTDLGAAATFTLACYALYRLAAKWTVWHLVFAGVTVGLAILTKFTGLMLLFVAPLVLVLVALLGRREPELEAAPWRTHLVRGLITLGVIVVASVIIVNAGYAFRGTLQPWSAYADEYGIIGALGESFLAPLAAPFPEAFVRGLAEQRAASVEEQFQFLWGTASDHGWWTYYAAAFLLKVPIATMGLLVLAVYAGMRRFDRRAFIFLVVPALFFFLVFSFGTRVNMGIRYMLPALTLMFILFGAIARDDAPAPLWRPAFLLMPALLVVWLAVEAAITCPQYLAYFNEFAGGHGERYLIDSNCDCSQDHIRLRRYLERHGIEEPYLATFGRVDAKVYGVAYKPLEPNTPVTGDVFISINLYSGYPYLTPNNGGHPIRVPRDGYAWLHDHKPLGKVGGSLYHFRIEPELDAPGRDANTHG